jgi:hypothetical protein
MMPILVLVALIFLAKIVLIDSPVGKALGDAIRNAVPPRAPEGGASRAELDDLRRDVDELRDQLERVIEEQSFITRLLSEPRRLSLGPGEVRDRDI